MSTPIRPRDGDDRSGNRDFAGSIPAQRVGSSPAAREFAGSGEAPARSTDDQHRHPVMPDRSSIIARQRERFGGVKIGSAFFGWLTATGTAVLLISLLAAAGVALGAATDTGIDRAAQDSPDNTGTAQTVGLVGAIVLLVVLFISYYCGGYVAGRMARFNGLRQGLAVCLWGLVMALLLAAIATIAGTQYGVFAGLRLPSLPVAADQGLVVGAIAIGAAILSALVGALLGGLAGMRFHRKVDKAGLDPMTG